MIMICLTTRVYAIEDYYIEATVEKNGDLTVEKYINLDSTEKNLTEIIQYNEYYKTRSVNNQIEYFWVNSLNDADKVILEEIVAVEKNKLFDFKDNYITSEKVSYTDNDVKGIMTYYIDASNLNNKAIYLRYRIANSAVLHNDIGEIFFRIFHETDNKTIKNFKLKVNIPNNQQLLNYWGNGLNNENFYNNGTTLITNNGNNLQINNNIELRIIFDKAVLSNGQKKSYREAQERIIRYENYAVDTLQREVMDVYTRCLMTTLNQFCIYEINILLDKLPEGEFKHEIVNKLDGWQETLEENADKKVTTNFWDDYVLELPPDAAKAYRIVRITFYVGTLVFGIYYLILKYVANNPIGKLHIQEYLRDFPSDIRPSAVTLLVKKKITSKAISADILDLIHRKVVIAKKDVNNEKNHILEVNNEMLDNLGKQDLELIKLIFDDKKTITMNELKKDAQFNKNNFKKRCSDYVYFLLQKYKYLNYFDKRKKTNAVYISIVLFIMIVLVTCCYSVSVAMNVPLEMPSVYYPMINFTYTIFGVFTGICIYILMRIKRLKFRSKKGQVEYSQWMSFKKFLTTFGLMDEKQVLEVTLWEKYLVYATALDCAQLVEKRLGFRLLNNFSVNFAYEEIFGIYLEDFNESISVDFDPIMEECNLLADSEITREEKEAKKAEKAKNR